MVNVSIVLRGGITGAMWWPVGVPGTVAIKADISRERERIWSPDGSRATLRDVLGLILTERGGDFSGSEFTADSYLEVTISKAGRTRSRFWELSAFPSVSDIVNADIHTHDFEDSGED